MSTDILDLPLAGRFLKWRHSRTALQTPVLLASIAMILHGLFGPTLSPKNLATTLTWIHFRGVLVFVLLAAGNFFCMACPFVLVRDLARRLHAPALNWPRMLRNKWIAISLFAGILFVYEAFSLWAKPFWTAVIVIGYFAAILAVDLTFKHAPFCKWVCPIGQFNFVASTLSPLEVKVRDQGVCGGCATKDCIKGNEVQRGCELALFQPVKVGNLDCTFCLDCVHACPHDNVGILSRMPADELSIDPLRSGIGYIQRRRDLSALVTLFTFGALMNAFGMVSPVYAFERWIAATFHIGSQPAVVGIVFAAVLIVEPLLLLSLATALTPRRPFVPTLVRYSYSLAPLGFGLWLAHYGFHLLTGLFTFIPVIQNAADGFLGEPHWRWVGLPLRFVQPIEFGFILLGASASLGVAYNLSSEDSEDWYRPFLPWAALIAMLSVAGIWLMLQPMDMRATFLE